MDPLTLVIATFWAAFVCTAGCTLTYGLLAPWWRSATGRQLFCLLAALTVSFAMLAFGRGFIPPILSATITYIIISAAMLGLWVVILLAQGKALKHHDDDTGASEDNPGNAKEDD